MSTARDEQPGGPRRFPVSIILERRPAKSEWADFVWTASGITVGRSESPDGEPRILREDREASYFLIGGLEIALHVDECESYYHNMMSPSPRAYVVARMTDDDERPQPFLVSMSFDEAHAYLEGDDEIYAVDVPAELYRWTEAYVIANYFPEKKRKRKLRDWRADESGARPA